MGQNHSDQQLQRNVVPCPRLITGFETLPSIIMLKGPPASIPRDFVTSESIGFAMGRHCGKQIEEVPDDLKSCSRCHADGNERVEGVTRKARV